MACLALLGVFAQPLTEIAKCIGPSIKRQFNYLCCFNKNIESLTQESHKLDDEKDGLEIRVGVADNRAEVILPQVKSWLENATKSQTELKGIELEISTMQKSNLLTKFRSRYSLSKKAAKKAEAIRELRGECNFDHVSEPAPPLALSENINAGGSAIDFESRKSTEDGIMSSLRDNNVSLLGIWGMGGVGKTVMAKKIIERVKRDNLFDEVVMVVVSQPLDLLKIQLHLMEQLGLDSKAYETSQARAHQLWNRLSTKKRTLVVLDDLWQRLDLKDVGIPFTSDSTNCKIFVTTRNHNILKQMDAKAFEIKSISNSEAWDLFKNTVGSSYNDDPELHLLAKDVVKECNGLPLPLDIIGRTLKGEMDVQPWKDALLQLRSANPIDMPEVLDGVYKPLKLSYDFLDSKNLKSLFRLCGVFPEDHDISLEELTRCGIGLKTIEGGGISTLEELRQRVFTLVRTLKNRSLLLEGKDKKHVKMHDVVRDVAIFIAKIEASPEMDCAAWVSRIPYDTFSPTLRLLTMQNLHPETHWNNLFDGTRDLNVLCFESISMSSLPQTTLLLKNLQVLHLIGCMDLKSISVIGELTSLEIISLKYNNSVTELPSEIRRLKHLRLLEVHSCKSLDIIQPGVISSLHLLEELKIRDSFKGWEAGEETRNASLKELESLTKLSCLEIEIENANLAAIEIALPPKVTKFYIEIGKRLISYHHDYGKMVSLDLNGDIILGNWIRKLLETSEIIELKGDAASQIFSFFFKFTYLKRLGIYNCSNIKTLINFPTPSITNRGSSFYPVLECLTIVDLCNFEKICDGSIPTGSNFLSNLKSLRLESLPRLLQLWSITPNPNLSLPNLSAIEIRKCHNLENLFQLSQANLQMESLQIENCNSMKEIFSTEMLREDGMSKNHLAFPKMKSLKIAHMSNLATFCKHAESIEFPQLVFMESRNLPKLNSLIPGALMWSARHNQDSFHFFCDSKVAFGSLSELWIAGVNENIGSLWCGQIPVIHHDFFSRLEKLHIFRCNGIKDLFASPIIAANLISLKWLEILNCPEMVQVIGDGLEEELNVADQHLIVEEAVAETSPYENHRHNRHDLKEEYTRRNNHYHVCPSLEGLWLSSLPKLERFVGRRKYSSGGDGGDAVVTIELPSLRHLEIDACGQMKRFTLPEISLTTPNLEFFEIDKKDMGHTKDVNGAIEQQYIDSRPTVEDASDEQMQQTLTIDSILVSEDCDFVIANNGAKISVSSLVGKSILLYFAGWLKSGRCRDFLHRLIEAYPEINSKGTKENEALQVIFISDDADQASYDDFLSKMPMQWLAIPFGDQRIRWLQDLFKGKSRPLAVAIGPTGNMLTTEAALLIKCYGARAYPFTAGRVKEIEAEDDKMVEDWPPQLMIDQLHPHNLVLTKRPARFCDGCGKDGGVWFYYCDQCEFDIHKACASVMDHDGS